jgi:hypothetical protein
MLSTTDLLGACRGALDGRPRQRLTLPREFRIAAGNVLFLGAQFGLRDRPLLTRRKLCDAMDGSSASRLDGQDRRPGGQPKLIARHPSAATTVRGLRNISGDGLPHLR